MSSIKLKVLNDIKSKITIQRDKLKAFYDRDVLGELITIRIELKSMPFNESNLPIINNMLANCKRLEALRKSHSEEKKSKALLELLDLNNYLEHLERQIYYCSPSKLNGSIKKAY